MKEKFRAANTKKFMENFKTNEDMMNIKTHKILSLRKKRNKKKNFYRILGEKEKEEAIKNKVYEFEENDFKNVKGKYNHKNEIFNLSFEKIFNNNPYDNEELKYWLYSMYKISSKGRKKDINEIILNYLTKEKINFLIDILTDSSQFNFSSNNSVNLEQIKNNIKFKYTICSILINLLCDTEKFNEIFIDRLESIYNFILILIQIYQNWNDTSFLILISHYQWLINNLIQDNDNYEKITKKYNNINFPQLIQNIFNINNSEIYLNNIRMLIIFLFAQSNKESFFLYNSFLLNLENIISISIENNNVEIILEAYEAINILFKSEANCKLVIENKAYIKLINKIIKGFNNNVTYCDCCLTKLIKNDSENILNDTYQLYKTLIEIIFKKIPAGKENIRHALKMLRFIIDNKNGFNIINFLINSNFKNFFIQLKELYSEKPSDLTIQTEVLNFLFTIFNLSNNSLKGILLQNELHIFILDCLGESYKEFMSDNKDNIYYIKLIIQMLKLLSIILSFGESNLDKKIELKNSCEEKNIYNILQELNYSKNKQIQNLVEELNYKYFEGYENEEFNDDDNEEKDNDELF